MIGSTRDTQPKTQINFYIIFRHSQGHELEFENVISDLLPIIANNHFQLRDLI